MTTFLVLFVFFIFSYIIKFLISILTGILGFWTGDVSGISSAVNVIQNVLSGSYFPLEAVGGIFSSIALGFPFAYTMYYPIQIFLGRVAIHDSWRALGIMLAWTISLWFLVRFLWKVGLKKYESAGI